MSSYVLAGISVFFWSTIAVSAKLLLNSFNNIQLLCLSSVIASAALLIFNIATGKIRVMSKYKIKDYFTIVLTGIPGIFLYHVFYYAGTDLLTSSHAVIINYLWPVMSILFACILLKEKLTVRRIISVVLSFTGVLIIAGLDISFNNSSMLLGALLCMAGAVSYGLFTALNQKFCYDKCIAMMLNFAVSFVLTAVILLFKDDSLSFGFPQFMGLMWNGIFTMAIPNTLWVIALEKGNTAKISNFAYITPFLSLLLSSLILNEKMSVHFFYGVIFIVLSFLVGSMSLKKR